MKGITAIFLLLTLCLLSPLSAEEAAYDLTLRVDAAGGKGSYATVQEAVDKALEFSASGQSVRVLVTPGTYRESVSLIGDRSQTYAPILIEGVSGEEVAISGTEVLNGWKLNGDTFECKWDYEKNLVPHLFVQGARVEYVPGARSLDVGQCTLRKGNIEMLPPRNAVVRDGTVEVALRPSILEVRDLPELTVQGISLKNGAVLIEDAPPATFFQNVRKLHLENVRVEANGFGMKIQQARDLVLAGVDCVRNRLGGAQIYWCSNVSILGGSFNLNGHGAPKDAVDAIGLATRKSQGLNIQRTEFNENRNGLQVEYASKETSMSGLHIYLNRGFSVQLVAVDELDLSGGQFACQGSSQLLELRGTRGTIRNTLLVAEGGDKPLLSVNGRGNLTFTNNIIAAFDHDGAIFDLEGLVTLEKASGNLYYSSDTDRAFIFKGDRVSLERWREDTGQDANSLWGDPLFTNRQRFDFSLRPASPWFKK